jgi:hypothetical protein
MSELELHYCSICGWEEKSYELPPRNCPSCGSLVRVGEVRMSTKGDEGELPKAVVEADALLIIRSITSAHEVFRKVLLERDLLLEQVERLKIYESEHERLKDELNRILHPNGDGPKAPSFCDLVAYVESDFRKLKDHNQALQENLEPMIEEELQRVRSVYSPKWRFTETLAVDERLVNVRALAALRDRDEGKDEKPRLCTFKGDEHACPHFCGPFGMPFLDPCQNQHDDVCVYDVPTQTEDRSET